MKFETKIIATLAVVQLSLASFAADVAQTTTSKKPAVAVSSDWKKPAWLTDLSIGVKEGYDDNLWMVSGMGLDPQSSWITTISPKVGVNFAPLLGQQKTWQTLSLVYAPDFAIFNNAEKESYNAHKIGNVIKGKTGDFSFSLDNAFLYNDGSSVAPIYAVNQGAAPNQYDKNRSAFATGAPRERREQIQDRGVIVLQYNMDNFFIRPTASLLYYDLMTDWHNTSLAPYKGYQNWIDRSDVSGGLDFGYKVVTNLAVTLGYRYGYQYQQAYPTNVDTLRVNGQQAQSSSDYQRILLGLEGKPWSWLTAKLAGGPDFRSYNSAAPVDDYNPVDYYGEASLVATLSSSQSLAFTYKHGRWVSSTGKVPTVDSSYGLAYRWNVTKQLGLDLAGKYAEGDYNVGSVTKSAGASLRDDSMYTISAGVSYAFTAHLNASLAYVYDMGRNLQDNVVNPPGDGWREFDHQLISLAAQYKF